MELPAIPGPSQTHKASRKRRRVMESDDDEEEELAVPFKIRKVSSLSLSRRVDVASIGNENTTATTPCLNVSLCIPSPPHLLMIAMYTFFLLREVKSIFFLCFCLFQTED